MDVLLASARCVTREKCVIKILVGSLENGPSNMEAYRQTERIMEVVRKMV